MNVRTLMIAAAMLASAALTAHAQNGESYEVETNRVQDYTVAGQGQGQVFVPEQSTWHAGYYHTMWGRPVALVVPPTVTHETNWGWGIGNTRINPVYAQYQGPMTAQASQYPYGPHRPTPYYVSDTLQFGVYYIRGPW